MRAAAVPAARPRRVAAPARPLTVAPAPRRVSGPARRGAGSGATRGRERDELGLAHGLLSVLERLPRRLPLGGRTWIALVAFALIGIVTLQLGLLKLNSGIGRAIEHEAMLQRENATLSIANSELAASERITSQAARLGMQFVAPGALRFLSATPASADALAGVALAAVTQATRTSEQAPGIAPGASSGQSEGPGSGAAPSSGEPSGAGSGAGSAATSPATETPSAGSPVGSAPTESAQSGPGASPTSSESTSGSAPSNSTSAAPAAAPQAGSGQPGGPSTGAPGGGTQAGSSG